VHINKVTFVQHPQFPHEPKFVTVKSSVWRN